MARSSFNQIQSAPMRRRPMSPFVPLAIVIVLFASSIASADAADDQHRKKLRAFRAYTLTEELSLDEATAAKLFPMLARFDAESDKIAARRADIQRRLATTTETFCCSRWASSDSRSGPGGMMTATLRFKELRFPPRGTKRCARDGKVIGGREADA